jgi:hypothetical protein
MKEGIQVRKFSLKNLKNYPNWFANLGQTWRRLLDQIKKK